MKPRAGAFITDAMAPRERQMASTHWEDCASSCVTALPGSPRGPDRGVDAHLDAALRQAIGSVRLPIATAVAALTESRRELSGDQVTSAG